MFAIVSGLFIQGGSYQRRKDNQTVLTVDIWDGHGSIRIHDVPSIDFKLGEEVTFPVRIFSNNRGLYVVYANQ